MTITTKLTIRSSKYRLAACLDTPDQSASSYPTVIACHGFAGSKHSGKIILLAEKLSQAGIATLRFDFSGHGEGNHRSEGELDTFTVSQGVEDLRAVIQFAAEHPNIDSQRIGFYATSIGANILLWTLGQYRCDIAELVNVKSLSLLAPLTDLTDAVIQTDGKDALRTWEQQGYLEEQFDDHIVRWHYDAIVDAQSKDTYQLAKAINIPTLIVHGNEDESVPVDQARQLANAMGEHAQLDILEGVGHRFSSDSEKASAIGAAAAKHVRCLT